MFREAVHNSPYKKVILESTQCR